MVTGESSDSAIPPSPRRIIKRYSNRKLYDTKGSSYVTLLQIAEMIREGEDVQIIDNATKEDKTDQRKKGRSSQAPRHSSDRRND